MKIFFKFSSVVLMTIVCLILAIIFVFYSGNDIESSDHSVITNVSILNDSVFLPKLYLNTLYYIPFELKNTGNESLIIQSVNTMCGCTVAIYDKKPTAPNKTIKIILEFRPNSLGYFAKSADVVCNVHGNFIKLKVKGEVVAKRE